MKKLKTISRFSRTLSRLDPIVFSFAVLAVLLYILVNKGTPSLLATDSLALPEGQYKAVLSVCSINSVWLGKYQVLARDKALEADIVFDYEGYPLGFTEGDRVSGDCSLVALSREVAYERSLLSKGVVARAHCSGFRLEKRPGGLAGIKWRLRASFRRLVETSLSPPLSSLLLGMLSGDDSNMPGSFSEIMRNVGLSHIVVVSGYNVSIVYTALEKMLRFLGRRGAALVGLIGLSLFAWIVGPEPPVLRAVAMAAIAAIATAAGRRVTGFRALLLGSALMLISKPEWINSISFHLSFLATLAIVYSGLLTPSGIDKLGMLGGFLKEFLIQTVVVLLFTLPYILSVFGQFSWISLVANLLVLPVCKAIMAFGATAIVVSIFSKTLGRLFFSFPWVLLWYVLVVSDRLIELSSPIQVKLSTSVMLLVYAILAMCLFVLNVVRNAKE